MAPQITFYGYVLSVVDPKRICVRIDNEYIDMVSSVMSSMNDKTVVKSTLIVGVSDCKFNITNIEWSELSHLVGVHIKINAVCRKYNYWKTRNIFDENNNGRIITVKYKGISIVAKQIANIID